MANRFDFGKVYVYNQKKINEKKLKFKKLTQEKDEVLKQYIKIDKEIELLVNGSTPRKFL